VARANFPPFPPNFPLDENFFHNNLRGTKYLTCRLKIIKEYYILKIAWKLWPQDRTDRHTYRYTDRHPTKEKIPYLVESETSLAQSKRWVRQGCRRLQDLLVLQGNTKTTRKKFVVPNFSPWAIRFSHTLTSTNLKASENYSRHLWIV